MASERDQSRRTEPLVSGIRESVAAGQDALGYVAEGVRETLRYSRTGQPREEAAKRRAPRRRAAGAGAAARRTAGPGAAQPRGDLIGEFAEIAAELFEFGAEIAEEVAEVLTEGRYAGDAEVPRLQLATGPGGEAQVEFTITNTGSSVLKEVQLAATELICGRRHIDRVTLDPDAIKSVRPGGATEVAITVAVPKDAEPGIYRGVVSADPGGAWALLELEVAADDEVRVELQAS